MCWWLRVLHNSVRGMRYLLECCSIPTPLCSGSSKGLREFRANSIVRREEVAFEKTHPPRKRSLLLPRTLRWLTLAICIQDFKFAGAAAHAQMLKHFQLNYHNAFYWIY